MCGPAALRTCSMDEYVGLPKTHEQSYHYFMWNNLFKHVSARRWEGCSGRASS